MVNTAEKVLVYKATNLVNGHWYIGYTARGLAAREKAHRAAARANKGHLLHAAIRKYGHENIAFEVMADFHGDEDIAKLYEREAIAAYQPEYNLTYGGEGGTLAAESRKKIGDANRGRKMPPSHGEKRRAFLLGRKHTPEAREKIRQANTGRPSPNKGVSPTAETRAKISAANKGQVPWTKGTKRSEETKTKIRAQRWNHSAESLRRIAKARKLAWGERTPAMVEAITATQKLGVAARKISVRCETDGMVFEGCSDADRFYGFRTGTVSRVLKGSIKNKTGKIFVCGGDK